MFAMREDNQNLRQYLQSDEAHEDPSTNVSQHISICVHAINADGFVYSDVNDHDSIVVRGMLKREPNPIKSRGRKMLKYASIKIKSEPKGEIEADPVGPDMDVNIIELVDAEAHAAVESVVNEETYANWAAAETESAAETASAEDIIEFEPKEAQDHSDQTAALYQTLQQDEQQPEVQLMVR